MRNAIAITFFLVSSPLYANEYQPQLEQLANDALFSWADSPLVIEALREQNAAHAGLSEADIIALDDTWRSEVGAADHPTIDSLLDRPGSEWLTQEANNLGGLVSEVFVMDNRGLNAMQSGVTSDYWQGDEAKWQETFGKPVGTLHFGDVELDESSQSYQSQVSFPVIDPETGEALGAITFGINLEAL